MKKLFFALGGLIALGSITGCSLNQSINVDSPVETLTGTIPDTSAIEQEVPMYTYDSNKFKLVVNEETLEGYDEYNDIMEYRGGSIGIQIGGNDGLTVSLTYKKDGQLIGSRDILWYGMDNSIVGSPSIVATDDLAYRTRCLDIDCQQKSVGDIQEVRVNCDYASNNTEVGNICVEEVAKYTYDLITKKERNAYFDKELDAFLSSIE